MFCTKCGNQVPDGSAVCPVCGAPMGAAAPQQVYAQPAPAATLDVNKFLSKLTAKADKVNWVGIIVACVTFIFAFMPAAKMSKKLYNLFSLTLNGAYFDFFLPLLFVPVMVLVLVSYCKKQNNMAAVYSVINLILATSMFIMILVGNGKIVDSYLKVGYKAKDVAKIHSVFFGIIVYFILCILQTAYAILAGIISKAIANGKQKSMIQAQQQQMMFAQQQQMFAQQQQMYAQQQAAQQQMQNPQN